VKAFFLSIFLFISSFFAPKLQTLPVVQTATESAVVSSPSAELTPTATPTIKKIATPSPTPVKPTSSITEEVLRKFLGQSEKASIDRILTDTNMLRTYEDMFYAKFKKFPIPRLDTNKTNAMPSKNGPLWCTGEQLKALYSDIEKTEKDVVFTQMDFDCHYTRSKMETTECQNWRRDNDQNRTSDSQLSSMDMYLMKIFKTQATTYDSLVEKYCVIK